jgi:hypothetical protein
MGKSNQHEQEREAYAEFASLYGEKQYRLVLDPLYETWRSFNLDFFDGRLLKPHLAIGDTPPRSLGKFSRTTPYGGMVEMTLNGHLVFGTNPRWVVRPWPAEGTRRFIEDLLLRFIVRQFVLEVLNADERGYRGYGPKFVEHANRIGRRLGLGPVVERHRGEDDSRPLATGWPHCVRDALYYGDDITEAALDLARGLKGTGKANAALVNLGMLGFVLHLLTAGRTDLAVQLIEGHLSWVAEFQRSRLPVRRQVEAGLQDVNGSPLGEVKIESWWLAWNGGTVLRIAEGIRDSGNFAELRVLAAALEEAGCGDGRILRHLREPMQHGRDCWVLQRLLALDEKA